MTKWKTVDVERTRSLGRPSKTEVSEAAVALIREWLADDDAPDALPFSEYDALASLANGGSDTESDNVSAEQFTQSESGKDTKTAEAARKHVNTVRERIRRNLKDTVDGNASVTVLRIGDGFTFGLAR